MNWSSLLCLGSTLSALAGLLLLNWAARRERRRFLWLLLAAALLIGAGFGTAETVYQLAVEEGDTQQPDVTPVSVLPSAPSPPATAVALRSGCDLRQLGHLGDCHRCLAILALEDDALLLVRIHDDAVSALELAPQQLDAQWAFDVAL